MTIAYLKEAAEVADSLTSGAQFKVLLSLERAGVLVKAIRGNYFHNYLVSWEQLSNCVINPLLPAIRIVAEPLSAMETSHAEG